MTQVPDMTSVFSVPDIKKTTSFRLAESLRLKIDAVREVWVALAEARGEDKAAIDQIDFTFVITTLLGRQADEELAQFGGYADTPEKKAVQLRVIRDTAKKQSK